MTVIGGVLCALVFGVVGLVAIAANGASMPSTAAVLATSAVPIPALIPVLDEAGSLCPGISAPLLAAQIDAESGWNPSAVSPAGAEGIAQFLPATFATYARNDDGTGNVSPFNPVDAVMAMGRYDCALLADVSGLTGQTPVSLMLAAYNAGIGAVLAFQGIPPYPETEAYVGRGGVTRSDLHSLPQLGLPFLLVWTTGRGCRHRRARCSVLMGRWERVRSDHWDRIGCEHDRLRLFWPRPLCCRPSVQRPDRAAALLGAAGNHGYAGGTSRYPAGRRDRLCPRRRTRPTSTTSASTSATTR